MAPRGVFSSLSAERARAGRFESVCPLLALAVPWLVALFETSPNTDFTQDLALVRTFGLLPVGMEGLVSTALGGLFSGLPLGPRVVRAGWASALALGFASWLVYSLAKSWFRARPTRSALDAPLSLVAALSTTLGPSWLVEGSTVGGASIAAALALLCVCLQLDVFALGSRRFLALGATLGLIAIESRWTALASLLALVLPNALKLQVPPRRELWALGLGLGLVLALPLALGSALFFSHSPDAALATGLLSHGWALQTAPVDRSAALAAWLAEVGLLWCLLGIFGLAFALLDGRLRPLVLPLVVFLVLDLLLGAAELDPTRRDPLSGARLLAITALGASGALAVRVAIDALAGARLPFASAASSLLVVYGFSLVFVSAESSAAALEVRNANATRSWTREALSALPPQSALLVRSEAVLFRLLAARVTAGSRPDVLLVPVELLARGGVRSELLARENGLVPLVREMLLSGRPSEYSLSALADTRPTYVELDPEWDPRLRVHMIPQAFFTEFAAHPLARSDRRLGLEHGEAAFSRVVAALKASPDQDPVTRSVLVSALAERALLLAALGDREVAARVVAELLALEPQAALGLALRERLGSPGKGGVDVSGLLARR